MYNDVGKCIYVVCEVLKNGLPDTEHPMEFNTERDALRHMRRIWSMGRHVYCEKRWL